MANLPVHARFDGPIVMIGLGSIGRGLLPLLERHIALRPLEVRGDRPGRYRPQAAGRAQAQFMKVGLTKANYREVLTPLLKAGPGRGMIVNLSVDTSSVDLMDLCKDIDAHYIDTVAEPWPGFYDDPKLTLSQRSNYALRERVLDLRRRRPGGVTAVNCCGANPGMVSWFVKQALLDVARDTGVAAGEPKTREDWARLMQRARRQGHPHRRARHPARPAAEAARTCSSTPGRSRASSRRACSRPSSASAPMRRRCRRTAIAMISAPAPRSIWRSRAPAPGCAPGRRPRKAQHGFLVTHNEAISIADYFTRARGRQGRSTGRPATTPTTPATTRCCRCTRWRATPGSGSRRGKSSTRTRSSTASTSSACCSTATPRTPIGTARSSRSRRRAQLAPYQNATGLQVTSAVLAGIVWMLENPDSGVIEADEMDFRRCLEVQLPYLGKVFGTYTDWTPLDRPPGAVSGGDSTSSDPWQFSNVLVR